MGLADEPRAEDDVGLVLDDRLDELGILLRVVLEVGILDDDDVAGGVSEAGAQGGPLALVAVVEDDLQVAVAACSSSRRISRVPSVEQSSTTMICFLIGTARTRRRISWIVRLLVVDRDDDREREVSGIGKRPSLRQIGSPSVSISQSRRAASSLNSGMSWRKSSLFEAECDSDDEDEVERRTSMDCY